MCVAGKDFSLASVGEGKENQIKVNWGRWINKDNETLFDLIFGCIVYSIVFEVIGLLVVENKGSYSMGLLLGTAVAVGLSVSMYNCLLYTSSMGTWSIRNSINL